MINNYEEAKNKLLTFALDDECQSFFEKNGYYLELGYSQIFRGDLKGADKTFSLIMNSSSRAHWAKTMTEIISNKLAPYPTYFEIRNYLEIDLNLLINYEQGDFVKEILSYSDLFSSVNPETFKYLGRVFWNNQLYSYGKFFLEQAKNHLYQDPELHILLAEAYIAEGKEEKALKSVQTCLNMIPEYFPALNLKRKLIKN